MKNGLGLVGFLFILSACGGGGGGSGSSTSDFELVSKFQETSELDEDGAPTYAFEKSGKYGDFSELFVEGSRQEYSYIHAVAINETDNQLVAYATIAPAAKAISETLPQSGIATYTGTYDYSIAKSDGISDVEEIDITLTADFGTKTLVGNDGTLKVDGTFTGNDINGSVV